jgi:hypothetical protein
MVEKSKINLDLVPVKIVHKLYVDGKFLGIVKGVEFINKDIDGGKAIETLTYINLEGE